MGQNKGHGAYSTLTTIRFGADIPLPNITESVRLPPRIILREHDKQPVLPPHHIECTFCSTLVFDPECWPVGAIWVTAVIFYFVITGCYVFFYIPLVLWTSIRVFLTRLRRLGGCFYRTIRGRIRRARRRPTVDLIELLALVISLTSFMYTVYGCKEVNIFSHHSTLCSTSGNRQLCKVQLSEVLKISPFKREACFKMKTNSTTVHEIRLTWRSLMLTCEPETDYFTRDVEYRVVDSKRCPHMGSCSGFKCAKINGSTLIPELEQGNAYLGTTYCVESCGGPGCDCWYWGSGCLFYRVYLVTVSNETYEIFHCNRWKEATKIEVMHFDAITNGRK
ncbi:hypothetical protein COOONC_01311 [Cooperia oncophora]